MRTRINTVVLATALLSLALASCGDDDAADAAAIQTIENPATTPTPTVADPAPVVEDTSQSPVDPQRGRNGRGRGGDAALPTSASVVTDSLNEAEIEGLVFMREEEKLARDVYLTLFDQWGLPIFENIAAAESRHTGAIEGLLDTYGIDDPVTDDSIGSFVDPDLKALFGQLVDMGSASLEDALTVGAMIEDLDILDLQDQLSATENPDVGRVYSNLLRGSENHLRSFTGQLSGRGIEYEAIYLDQSQIDTILEAGGGRGQRH